MARAITFNKSETLDKAVNLFWEKGYNATSANDIVSTLGLSRSSLYGTYGNKRALFLTSLKKYQENDIVRVQNIFNNVKTTKKGLKKLFQSVIDQDVNLDRPKGCFMVNSAIELNFDEDVVALINIYDQHIEQIIKESLKKDVKSGLLDKKTKSKHLAKFLINQLKGLRVSAKYTKDEETFLEVTSIALSVL